MEAMNLFRAYRQTPLERFPGSSSSWPTESNGTESGCDSGGFLLLEGSSPLGQSISALLRLPHHKWRSRGAGGQAICKLRQSQSHFIFRTFVLAGGLAEISAAVSQNLFTVLARFRLGFRLLLAICSP